MWSQYWMLIVLLAAAGLFYLLYHASGSLGWETRGVLDPIIDQIRAMVETMFDGW